jgi:hypothetical protein
MKIVGPSSPDEVIATWLRADLDSKEIKAQTVRHRLLSLGVGEEALDPASQHATDASRPHVLRKLLMMCHGNTVRELVLDEIDWSWAELRHDDPLFLMNYRDFREWTHGTLLPRDAIEGFAQNRPFDSLTARIRSGESLPPCICVALDASNPAVLLDGNGRAIAFASLGRHPELILLGLSPAVTSWYFYPPPSVLSGM